MVQSHYVAVQIYLDCNKCQTVAIQIPITPLTHLFTIFMSYD